MFTSDHLFRETLFACNEPENFDLIALGERFPFLSSFVSGQTIVRLFSITTEDHGTYRANSGSM
jgi:hypothetical protein